MAITKLSHKPFWEIVGKNARDMIKKSIFDRGKNVYGSKWLDGKYSKAYGAKKAANKFKRQSSTKVAPVLTGDLVNDLGSFVKANPNGFITGFPTFGNIVQGLRKRFGKKGTITSKDRPLPIEVLKYVKREYHKHIKKNQKPTTRIHKIGRK